MKIIHQVENENLRQRLLASYEKHQEFRELIDLLEQKKTSASFLEKFQISFFDYIYSLDACEQSSTKCAQKVEGYRIALKFENNLLNKKLIVCQHKTVSVKKLSLNYKVANFPTEFLHINLTDVNRALKERTEIVSFMNDFLLHGSFSTGSGYFLSGAKFTGKTFLTVFFCNRIIARYASKVAFTNSAQLLSYYQNNNSYGQSFLPLFEQLKAIDVLVIDNFGSESFDGRFRDVFLIPLLEFRFDQNRPTMILSNFTLSEVSQNYFPSNIGLNGKKRQMFSQTLSRHLKSFSLTVPHEKRPRTNFSSK